MASEPDRKVREAQRVSWSPWNTGGTKLAVVYDERGQRKIVWPGSLRDRREKRRKDQGALDL